MKDPQHFISSVVLLQAWPTMVAQWKVIILPINNLRFKVLSLTCFQISEKTLIKFSMALDSKTYMLNLPISWIRESLIQCYFVKILSIQYFAERRRLR